jgi:hypothetical protein
MVAVAALLWLVLCSITMLLLGLSERSFLLFTPRPRWPFLLIITIAWCVALKASYWWFFERYMFYGGK